MNVSCQDDNMYNARIGVHLNLKRPEKARILVNKIPVDKTKEMIDTFSPQQELHTHEIAEDTTPSGILARGSYSATTKFLDDDNKCYLELNYTFDIRKDWQSS